jgi:hypothetical protein
MRHLSVAMAALLGLSACDKSEETDTGNGNPDTGDTGEEVVWPSTFEAGQYRLTQFVLLEEEDGDDLDGDGVPDNNLPNALVPVDAFIEGDLSREGLNAQIEAAIAADDLIILLEAAYDEGVLSLDVLAGLLDKASVLQVDVEASYEETGAPLSHLEGTFADQTGFDAGPGSIRVPGPFSPDDPAIPVPLEEARIYGTMDGDTTSGRITGIIPAQRLVDEVIDPLIPEAGYGSYTKEQIMEMVSALAENENIADQELPGGERGVSAAFSYSAPAAVWVPPEIP